MKNFIVFFSLISLLFVSSFNVEARKKFGSKSTGKTQQTSTTQQKQQTDTKAISPTPTTKPQSSKKGIMAGVLGGLLAGGLIAAMLGDDFEGFQFLEMILLALAAFVIFKLIKGMMQKRQQPHMAGGPQMGGPQMGGPQVGGPQVGGPQINPEQFNQPQQFQTQAPTSGFGQQDSVPFNLPSHFDVNGFLQGARQHYHTLQDAWNKKDYTTMAEYLSPELVDEFKQQRENEGDVATEVMFIDAQLVRADTKADVWEVSILFKGKYRDLGDKQEEPIHEVWHLERQTQDNAPWLIVGVEDLIEG
ncbi:Tim44 domain-containing protein [Pseudoalteromonas sp. S16_S37]|uniref:Tim44 domain-containing protein n=1 Tax=Pseudoalteromonas sp. S16_S37 TaxID=2720228 RepID=UPI001680EC7A|nr:Tim44-like domain-containing protein [Pseudoalteromonas sp. S16_S37]MBD1584814.1 Tim44 domain-containing protein [Pseudoalteromonas sp. S16_S37]